MHKIADHNLECIHIGKRRQKQKKEGRPHCTSHARAVGWESLAVAVIEQSISDYFTLVHAGAVKYGKPTGTCKGKKSKWKNGNVYYASQVSGILLSEIPSTIDFLRRDVIKWSVCCNLNEAAWAKLYDAILKREKSGIHYFHHNSERAKQIQIKVNYAIA